MNPPVDKLILICSVVFIYFIQKKTNLLEGKEKYAKRVLDEANKVLSQKMEFEKEKNKSILAKFMESNRKTFLQELHKSKFKLDKSDLQKLEKLKNLDKELATKSIAKKDAEFLQSFKKVYKEKTLKGWFYAHLNGKSCRLP